MPRCDYDVVFYRVFCITLLGVAFSFTVILTNVFIDIDGLLYNKEKDKTQSNLERVKGEYEVLSTNSRPEYEDYDYSDTERSKRSLDHVPDSDELLQDVKDAKIKKYLRSHFSKYFEVLNFEENPANDTDSKEKKDVVKNDTDNLIKDIQRLKEKKEKKDNKMLHLAIHNIVLQGIIGHMDMKEVYRKAHELAQNLEHSVDKDKLFGYNKLINELMDCKDLQNEIMKESIKKANNNTRRARDKQEESEKTNNRNIFVKTLINITSLLNDEANQEEDSVNKIDSNIPPEEITGMIKLIYNGQELKFKKMETTKTPVVTTTTEPNYLSKEYLNNMLKEYFKRFQTNDDNEPQNIRLKRRADSAPTTKKPHSDEEDELFVEIETHVGTKGMKGEKKKKMIRDLVDKIQKALHSEKHGNIKNKHKSLHVKKRMQNPLDRNEEWIHTIIHPVDKYFRRQSHPISESVPLHDHLPYMTDHQGNNWRKFYSGPHFLDPSKGINSAEMSQVEAIYDKVPQSENDIPKRLQLPLISEDNNYYYNKLGNLRFLVKDIEGSGFSIGYNQYTDEIPDPDSMKLFTGLENVIKSYHRKYDENESTENQELPEHDIVRRSAKDTDYHSNEYKIIFNNNFLPYNNYQDVTNQRMFKDKNTISLDKAIFIDDSLFDKNLKPAEILSLANFYGRNKRSVKVKKISNLKINKNKKKINRYLNTNTMAHRSLFIQKKRNKRQIDKIRIIARDMNPKKSEEDIFVVSEESNFGDRPIIKHNIVQIPRDNFGEKYAEPYDFITPSTNADNDDDRIDVLAPYMYKSQKENAYEVFSKISRQNSLMSKYPHIFLDELSMRNNDDDSMVLPTIYSHNNDDSISFNSLSPSTTITSLATDTVYYPQNIPKPMISDFASLLNPPDSHDPSKKNYKFTIKITPKNSSAPEGFKEIHTSVNKSYNQNGMMYTSMVNVSELSKVEQLREEQVKNKDKDIEKLRKEEQIKQLKISNMNKLKAEHDKIKKFIDIHKNRLEEQLKLINSEKEKLDKIYQTDELFFAEHFKNASKASDHLIEPLKLNISRKVTTEAHKKKTALPTTTTESIEKLIMYNSIHKNENVTNEILSKINKNNDLLKTFLEKIINKLDLSTTSTTEILTTETHIPTQETTATEWKLPEPYEQMRRIFFKNNPIEVKNDSDTVPFIYMYQHPINVSQGPANILYQGHIHSKLFHKMKKAHEMEEVADAARRQINMQPPIKPYINNIVTKPFDNEAKPFNDPAVSFNSVAKPSNDQTVSFNNVVKPFNDPAVHFNNVEKPFNDPAVPFNNVEKSFNDPAVPFNNVEKPFNDPAVSFNNINKNYNNEIKMLTSYNDNILNNNFNNVPINYLPNKLDTLKQFINVEKIETEKVKNGTRFFIDDLESELKPEQNMDNKLQKIK